MRQKISMITLGVKDLQKATEFYAQGLGWKKSIYSTGDLVVFSLGSVALALYPRKLLAEDANVDDAGSGFSGVTLSHFAKSETEVNDVMAEVQKLGATIVKSAQKVFWGGYSGYFKDPDGHLIEVAFNPFWAMDEDGNLELSL
jgi:uncharacterized protein